jgi:hypothetical protein
MSAETPARDAQALYAKREADAAEELRFELIQCAETLRDAASALTRTPLPVAGTAGVRFSMRGVDDALRKLDVARAAREASDVTAGGSS